MTFLSEGGPKTCPAWGLLAPASTPRCDCSYAFRGDLSALESPGPMRIGGWLTLVALGVCAAPIIIIAQTAQLLPVFEADTWKRRSEYRKFVPSSVLCPRVPSGYPISFDRSECADVCEWLIERRFLIHTRPRQLL
jgi:hypothetical protein